MLDSSDAPELGYTDDAVQCYPDFPELDGLGSLVPG